MEIDIENEGVVVLLLSGCYLQPECPSKLPRRLQSLRTLCLLTHSDTSHWHRPRLLDSSAPACHSLLPAPDTTTLKQQQTSLRVQAGVSAFERLSKDTFWSAHKGDSWSHIARLVDETEPHEAHSPLVQVGSTGSSLSLTCLRVTPKTLYASPTRQYRCQARGSRVWAYRSTPYRAEDGLQDRDELELARLSFGYSPQLSLSNLGASLPRTLGMAS